MKRVPAVVLLAFSAVAFAQAPQIKSGSTVYIEPLGGYETYLAAAMVKKQVPLVMVSEKEKADFIIRSTVSRMEPGQAAVVINNTANIGDGGNSGGGLWDRQRRAASQYVTSSIAVIDARSSQIVFAYSADNNVASKVAEACAKHLKEFIEKPKK